MVMLAPVRVSQAKHPSPVVANPGTDPGSPGRWAAACHPEGVPGLSLLVRKVGMLTVRSARGWRGGGEDGRSSV